MAEVRGPRQVNADGSTNIICSVCGKIIGPAMFRGFTSAICEECHTGRVSPYSQMAEEMDHLPLYNTEEEETREDSERVGLVQYLFRAIGFGKKKSPEPGQSEVTAKRKKRRGLFTEPDEDRE